MFPYSLGGENLYMDCVCEKCNNYFSGLELELYQKSFVGLLRSTMGVEGYSSNERTPAPFKAPILLSFDEKNQVVLEMGQYFRMQVFVRPQVFTLASKFYTEAESLENRQLFTDAFVKWKKSNAILTARNGEEIIHIKFILSEGHYSSFREPAKTGVKKPIQYCTLPESHELYPSLNPRFDLVNPKSKTSDSGYLYYQFSLSL